jgi:lipopolysaccharide biosynthesis glycosyltransferase
MPMEPVVLALASNERYFAGLYCAVASALSTLDAGRQVNVKVLDGGISQASKDTLSRLIDRIGERVRLEFVPIGESLFQGATLGPARSHMAYCRILLPRVSNVPRLIYLDCDTLVFRDLSELFDRELPPGKFLGAVPDSETLTLADDSRALAEAMNLPPHGRYFNSGLLLLNLNELTKEKFTRRALDFIQHRSGQYRFHDQSAFNFLLHSRIAELPEHWNRASWRFDQQQNNDLDCVLHYTGSVPWVGGIAGPAQELFERFAEQAGLPVNRQSVEFKRSARQNFLRNALAPARTLAFLFAALVYKVAGIRERSAAYKKVAHYWLDYILSAPSRRRLYRHRSQEIQTLEFKLPSSQLAS